MSQIGLVNQVILCFIVNLVFVLFNALAGLCGSLAMAVSSALYIFNLLVLIQAQSESQQPKIQLRLAGDKRKHYEGRLEVFYNNEWGTVCDDDFSIEAAHVACRQLGFLGAVAWSPSAKFGKGEGRQELLQKLSLIAYYKRMFH